MIPLTADELAGLRATIDKAPDVAANADGEVLRYDFDSDSSTTVTDVSGNGYDGTIVGTSAVGGGEMTFSGDDYVRVPDNIMSGIEDITVEAQVYLDSSLSGNYFIYGLGNTDGAGVGNGYLFTSGNRLPDQDRDGELDHRTSGGLGLRAAAQHVGDPYLHAARRRGDDLPRRACR